MSDLDCVVVGYLDDVQPEDVLRTTGERAATGLIERTFFFGGRRYTINGLMSAAIEQATGEAFPFHVAATPSLTCCYLTSFLRKRGLNVEFVNFVNSDIERFDSLLERRPRAVALTTTFYSDSVKVGSLVRLVHERSPGTKVIVGGPYIHRLWTARQTRQQMDAALDRIGADIYVVDSQGELTLSRVCSALRDGGALGTIPNVIHRENGDYARAQGPADTAESAIPAPARKERPGIYGMTEGSDGLWRIVEDNSVDREHIDWSLFDGSFLAPMVQTRTARSCAFQCAFCSYPSAAGPLVLRSLESIESELDYLARAGVRYIVFNDDTFNVPMPRFKDVCRLLAKSKYDFRWCSFFRAANSDEEMFDLMARSGCTAVMLGIESGDARILKNMNKAAKVEDYYRGMRELHKRRITTFASFIVGFPGETEETMQSTVDFIRESRPNYFELEVFYYEHGTPISRRADEFGLAGGATNWRHDTMSCDQARVHQKRLMRELMAEGHTWCDVSGFSIWGYAYMLSLGFTRAQADRILDLASRMNFEGKHELHPAYTRDYEADLVGIVRSAAPALHLRPH